MAEVFTSDNSVTTEVMESQEADIADSLRVGEEIEAAHEQRLAGKYRNTEELEAAYLELQKKLGSSDEEQVEEESPSEEKDYGWVNEMQTQIKENGELSQELMEQISQMNGTEVLEALASSQPNSADLSQEQIGSIYNSVGGAEAYNSLIDWAQENFSEAEIDAYDQMIDSGNMAQINLALQALYFRYSDSMGYDGETLQGKPAQTQTGFRSQQELIEAMNDPRYDDDPAYRQDVLDKLDRSNVNF